MITLNSHNLKLTSSSCLPLTRSNRPSHRRTNNKRQFTTVTLVTDTPLTTQSPDQPSTYNPPSWPSEAARRAAFNTTQLSTAENIEAQVTGRIPEWLSGQYLRNGPGVYSNGSDEGMYHMFDGLALVVKMDIDGEKNIVKGSHSFVETDAYQHYKATGKQKWREFATPVPAQGPLSTVKDMFTMIGGTMGLVDGVTDNASVNILPAGENQAWATTETVRGTLAFDTENLRTIGRITYDDSLRGDLTTAHPTRLPNGDVINFLSTVGVGFQVYRHPSPTSTSTTTPTPISRQHIATIPHRKLLSPSWVHDFPGSTTHIVIPDSPLFFNLGSLMTNGTTDHIFMDWVPEERAVLHVVRLRDGMVKSYYTDPFFAFHWANAFVQKDEGSGKEVLCIDGAIYKDPTILNDLYLDTLRKNASAGADDDDNKKFNVGLSPSSLSRLTIDLDAPSGSTLSTTWQPLVKDAETAASAGNWFEFPRVNPNYKGKHYRYVWCACANRPTNAGNALAKVDTHTGEVQVWTQPGGLIGEPVFVPRPGGIEEDDGVVVVMTVESDGKAAVLFVDGKSHEEVARARLPYELSNGFHGTFISKSK